MPFKVVYRDEYNRVVTLDNVTKLDGMWDPDGVLLGYYLHVGRNPQEHRRLRHINTKQVMKIAGYREDIK